MKIKLKSRQRELIRQALRIASKDGSLYGAEKLKAAQKKIDARVEKIERKLNERK